MYMYMYMCIYMYIYMYICMCVYVCILYTHNFDKCLLTYFQKCFVLQLFLQTILVSIL